MPEPARSTRRTSATTSTAWCRRTRGSRPTCRVSTTRRCSSIERGRDRRGRRRDRPRPAPGRRADLMAHSQVVDALADARRRGAGRSSGRCSPTATACVDELLAADGEHFVASAQRARRDCAVHPAGDVRRGAGARGGRRRRTRDRRAAPPHPGPPRGTPHPDLVRLGELVSAALEHKRADDTDLILATMRPHVARPRRTGRRRCRPSPRRRAPRRPDDRPSSSRTRSRGSPRRCTSGSGCA